MAFAPKPAAGAAVNPFAPKPANPFASNTAQPAATAPAANPFAPKPAGTTTAPAANPFAPKPAAANPFAPAATTAAPGTANPFAKPAGATAANPFATKTALAPAVAPVTTPVTVQTVVSTLPADLRNQLTEMNTLIHNSGQINDQLSAKFKIDEQTDMSFMDVKLAQMREMLQLARDAYKSADYTQRSHAKGVEAVKTTQIQLLESANDLHLRSRVALVDTGEEEIQVPCPFLTQSVSGVIDRATSVAEVLSQIESFILPQDLLSAAESAAKQDADTLLTLQANFSQWQAHADATAFGSTAGMELDGTYRSRADMVLKAYDSPAVDENEMGRLREAARSLAQTLPTLELLKQVIVAETAAISAVAGGPLRTLHEQANALKRRTLTWLNGGANVSSSLPTDDQDFIDMLIGDATTAVPRRTTTRKVTNPYEDRLTEHMKDRRRVEEARELRIPKPSSAGPGAISTLDMLRKKAASGQEIAAAPGATAPAATATTSSVGLLGAKPNPFAPTAATTAATTTAAAPVANPFAKPATTAAAPGAAPAAAPNPFAPKTTTAAAPAPAANPFAKPAATTGAPTLAIPASTGLDNKFTSPTAAQRVRTT